MTERFPSIDVDLFSDEAIVAGIDSKLVQFERFEGCGHGVWRDDPKRGLSVLRDFIRTAGMEG